MNFSKRTYEQVISQSTNEDSFLLKVGEKELGSRFRSMKDLYTYLTEVRKTSLMVLSGLVHFYLPPLDLVNKNFLKKVLRNEKSLLKMEEVKLVKVPTYEELSVKAMYDEVLEDEDVRKYLPDQGAKAKPIHRFFFFNILNSVYPEYVQALIEESQRRRNEAG